VIEQIEKNISQKTGLGFLIMIVMGFVALVLSQPYIIYYRFSFIALLLTSFFLLCVWKVIQGFDEEH
jgi:hypothetical protein